MSPRARMRECDNMITDLLFKFRTRKYFETLGTHCRISMNCPPFRLASSN